MWIIRQPISSTCTPTTHFLAGNMWLAIAAAECQRIRSSSSSRCRLKSGKGLLLGPFKLTVGFERAGRGRHEPSPEPNYRGIQQAVGAGGRSRRNPGEEPDPRQSPQLNARVLDLVDLCPCPRSSPWSTRVTSSPARRSNRTKNECAPTGSPARSQACSLRPDDDHYSSGNEVP